MRIAKMKEFRDWAALERGPFSSAAMSCFSQKFVGERPVPWMSAEKLTTTIKATGFSIVIEELKHTTSCKIHDGTGGLVAAGQSADAELALLEAVFGVVRDEFAFAHVRMELQLQGVSADEALTQTLVSRFIQLGPQQLVKDMKAFA